jgi:rod shape-determining protein MreC
MRNILLRNHIGRFLKRTTLIKAQSSLMFSLTAVFLCLICARISWVESLVEKTLLEITGHLSLFSQKGQKHLTQLITKYTLSENLQLIKNLEKENALLRNYFLQLKALQAENKILQKMARLVSQNQFKNSYTAQVLTSPLRGWNKMFLVSAGTVNGVKQGQPVVCGEGILGRVDSVSEHFCRVMPLTHQDFRIPVLGIKTRAQGILAGNGSENPFIMYLQDDHPIKHKEIFISSAQGGAFPPGHLVGQVTYNTQKTPLFKTFIPWRKLEYVQIILTDPIIPKKERPTPLFNKILTQKVSP